ncbi:DUF2920 family protein [Pelosinus sp. UFO1]|uniref:DUF2920 family protein n=1 Tax=Pelosinus sp. UFO1 TaxID=484770 RepID=UPI0004D1F1F1|nr:DUF2920 family protein [Pelosinus sp. UFO1]AIF52330.1 Protein of unknown function DUF2920 [Pelosinus sp. UFO1]
MAKEHTIDIPAHCNIYCNAALRTLRVCFSEPSDGINDDTGILLLIPGFGADLNSNVYKKMREIFADQYNLITIQCDYFGQEYMQEPVNMRFDIVRFLEDLSFKNPKLIINESTLSADVIQDLAYKYNITIFRTSNFNETIENFNDMGLMQTLDNLTAILAVIAILNDNKLIFNAKKIIAYGHSHGAYLGYLCNAFAPTLFSLLIDNSAWLFPRYLNPETPRTIVDMIASKDETYVCTYISSLAAQLSQDKELLELPLLYKQFNNNCIISSFHGTTDTLISCTDKKVYCSSIPFCQYNEISAADIDGVIFRSTNHGLDADFLEFFHYNMARYKDQFSTSSKILLPDVVFKTTQFTYEVDYSIGFPNLIIKGEHSGRNKAF